MLTKKKQDFIEAYVATQDKFEAGRQAGYSQKSAKSFENQVNNLLRDPEIKAEISQRMMPIVKRAQERGSLSAQELMLFWSRVVEFDILEVFDQTTIEVTIGEGEKQRIASLEGFKVRNLASVPVELRRLIKRVRQTKEGLIEIEFVDKIKASELLARAMAMFGATPPETEEQAATGAATRDLMRQIRNASPEELKDLLKALKSPDFQKLSQAVPVESRAE